MQAAGRESTTPRVEVPEDAKEGQPGEVGPDQAGEEMADVRVQRSPAQPSRQEVDEHEATCHSVYRSWCKVCIESRGIGQQHRAAESDNETSLPEVCMDYFYMSDETGVKPLPHIVLKVAKPQSSHALCWNRRVSRSMASTSSLASFAT